MRYLTIIALFALCAPLSAVAQDEAPATPAEPEAAQEAPEAPVEPPAPTLDFRTSATIPMPTAIQVDASVACHMDGTVLHCTARRAQ